MSREVINDPFHGFTIAKEAGLIFNPACDQVIARTLDGELLGGVVYSGFNPGGSISMHMAGFDPHWINRDLIYTCFAYPFIQLGVKKIFAHVPENNATALAMNRRFGFLRELRIKDVFEDCDLILMDMYRDECKWIRVTPAGYHDRRR